MDEHFSEILAPVKDVTSISSLTPFIPSSSYIGSKKGYFFKKDSLGLGYYVDNQLNIRELEAKKRKREEEYEKVNRIESNKINIQRMLDDADREPMISLDNGSLKGLLLNFEKKISKNQKLRMKYPEDPSKFMDSEIELHGDIEDLQSIATSPELYSTFVEVGAVTSVLGMLTHENTDISVAAVTLIQEMTDPKTILELEESIVLIDAFLDGQGLELIIQNLSRLDEENDEDAQGVFNTMGIIENLIEIRPSLAITVCDKTHILKFLLNRLKMKKFDGNKLYCSEILSILLQSDPLISLKICNLHGVNGMEMLLQCVASYRKKDIIGMEEEECIENIFLCLNSTLIEHDNHDKFLNCEGFELLIRCIKEQKYASICSIKSISFAITNNKVSCEKFIENGGLKYIFPVLIGRGLPKNSKKKGSNSNKDIEDSIIKIICELCLNLYDSTVHDSSARLLNKFIDNENEKVDRCIELYLKYRKQLMNTEQTIEQTVAILEKSGDQDELDDYMDDDNIYDMRLEGGLQNMQYLSYVLAYVCIFNSKCYEQTLIKLSAEDSSLTEILAVLRESTSHIDDSNENKRLKSLLISWIAGLDSIINQDNGEDKNEK
jgi:beta-catenin-like protein 1